MGNLSKKDRDFWKETVLQKREGEREWKVSLVPRSKFSGLRDGVMAKSGMVVRELAIGFSVPAVT